MRTQTIANSRMAGVGFFWASILTGNDTASRYHCITRAPPFRVATILPAGPALAVGCPDAPPTRPCPVKPNQVARFVAVVLAIAGIALIGAAGVVSMHSFRYGRFDCGSVLFAKDPRNLASKQASVPRPLIQANNQCEKTRTSRTHTATTFLVAGAAPLLLVLALPAISRQSRRRRRRARM